MSEQPGRNETVLRFGSRMIDAAIVADRYYTPLLFLFGTIGNFLSLAVFCLNSKYRSQSASYYLSALSVSDTGYLINLLAVWLEHVYGGVITSGVMCPLVMYLGQVTCFVSVYLTVAFSIERYIAVNFPLSRPRICTRSKARKVIAFLTVVALLLFSYAWVIARVIEIPSSGNNLETSLDDESVKAQKNFNLAKNMSQIVHPSEGVNHIKNEQSLGYRDSSTEFINFNNETSPSPTYHFGRISFSCDGDFVSYNGSGMSKSEGENCGRIRNWRENSSMVFGKVQYSPKSTEAFTQVPATSEKNLEFQESTNIFTGGYICSVPRDYYRVSEIANYFDTLITFIIPFALIAFFNVQIALCVWRLNIERQKMIASPASTQGSYRYHHNVRRSDSKGRKQMWEIEQRGSPESFTEDSFPQVSGSRTNMKLTRCCLHTRDHQEMSTSAERCSISLSSRRSEQGSANDVYYGAHFLDDDGRGNGDVNLRFNNSEMANFNGFDDVATIRFNRSTESRVVITPVAATWRRSKPFSASASASSSTATEVRVTKTLLLISTIFVVLNLPAHAVRCAQFIQTFRGDSEGNELLYAAQIWTNILFNTNFAINFLLYCASGRSFRQALKNMILRRFFRSSRLAWKHASKKSASATVASRVCKSELQVVENVELHDTTKPSAYHKGNPLKQGNVRGDVRNQRMPN